MSKRTGAAELSAPSLASEDQGYEQNHRADAPD